MQQDLIASGAEGLYRPAHSLSLAQTTVPPCLKASTIHACPKKIHHQQTNWLPHSGSHSIRYWVFWEPGQKSRHSRWGIIEDAVATAIRTTLTHLEHKESYARFLFTDFSSAFNTITPSRLGTKLINLPYSIWLWIKDFLRARPQRVKEGPKLNPTFSLNIGLPQGCVLTLLLYTLYTPDCTPLTQATQQWISQMTWQRLDSSWVKMSLHTGTR